MSKTAILSAKQILFCQEYLIDLNATQAAIRAGYSPKTATEQSSRLLTNVKIQNYISELKAKRSDKVECTAEMVLLELMKIGFSDIGEYMDAGYSLKQIMELKDKSRAIQSIQVDEFEGEFGKNRSVKFKLHDKQRALEMIAKHIGFFEADNKQKGDTIAPVITTFKDGKIIDFKIKNSCLHAVAEAD